MEIQVVNINSSGAYVLSLPNNILYKWYTGEYCDSLVQRLNISLKEKGTIIKVVACSSVEERLRKSISKLYHKVSKLSWYKREKILKEVTTISVFPQEIVNPHELQENLETAHETIENFK